LDESGKDTKEIRRKVIHNPTFNGYRSAIESLEDLFGGHLRLQRIKLEELRNFDQLTPRTVKEFRHLLSAVQEYHDVLEQQGKVCEFENLATYQVIEPKLSYELRTSYYEYCEVRQLTVECSRNLLTWMKMKSKFITRATRAEESLHSSSTRKKEEKHPETKPPLPNKFKAFPVMEETEEQSDESEGELAMLAAAAIAPAKKGPECPICKTSHWLIKCPRFKDMSPQARRDVIMKHKRCFVCFKEHLVKDCTYGRSCGLCDGRHHPLLHIKKQKAISSNVVVEEQEEEPLSSEEQ
jgi:hypothetical protein